MVGDEVEVQRVTAVEQYTLNEGHNFSCRVVQSTHNRYMDHLQHNKVGNILRRVHTPKVGFYVVYFFLLFSNISQKDPTFGYYNLAHSDVTVFHSFKPKVGKTFMNTNE